MKDCSFQPNNNGTYTCEYCGLVFSKNIRKNCTKFMTHDSSFYATLQNAIQHQQEPSLLQKAWNFGKSALNHAIAGNPTVPEETMKERLEICRSCPLFKPNQNQVGGVCTHSTCGCNIQDNLDYLNKIAWADQECPVQKWGKYVQDGDNKGV